MTTPTSTTTPRRMLRRPAVEELVGLKRDTIYKRIREGTFPRPRKISARASAWCSDEIEAWINSRPIAGSESDQPAGGAAA